MKKQCAGVDGCKHGWAAAVLRVTSPAAQSCAPQKVEIRIFKSFAEILEQGLSVIAVDIPIGLTHGPPRECDRMARRLLGKPRSSSVFSAPVRPALYAGTYQEALSSTRGCHPRGKGLSRQTFSILPKVREVDDLMTPELQNRVIETFPEIVFWALNKGRAMKHSKKKEAGKSERIFLLGQFFPEIGRALKSHPRAIHDDIIDAFAALWTAVQYLEQNYRSIPEVPDLDPKGLRMEIIYPISAQAEQGS